MITPALYAKYAADPAAFRADLTVDVNGIARGFGDVMDDWQRDDFAAMDPALLRCNGREPVAATTSKGKRAKPIDAPVRSRVYLERPRGHSKTTDLAVTVIWALAFAKRSIRGYAFAADQGQAKLLRDACATLLKLNPWLSGLIEVQANVVANIGEGHPGRDSRMEVATSDVGSSYGILPDLIIADELTHWKGDGSLWHSLLSSAAKRTNCLLVIISNAGFVESWQWTVREAARAEAADSSGSWLFRRLNGPAASWMTEARLNEQRRMLPTAAFLRLWMNEWVSGGGDALTPDDIAAAFSESLRPMPGPVSGYAYVAGVDLGLTRDLSAVVTLAVPRGPSYGRIRLADAKYWRPSPGRKIDLIEVESYLLSLDRRFGLENIGFDPWQAELLAARIEADTGRRSRNARRRFWRTPFMREFAPTAPNLREQATLVIESFRDRRFEFYPHEPLRRDLSRLRVEEKSYGIRLTSPRDADGHGDTFSAFALALVLAHEVSGKRKAIVGSLMNKVSDLFAGPRESSMAFEVELTRQRNRELEVLSGPDPVDRFAWMTGDVMTGEILE